MTCIVGVAENGIVYIGGDSAAADENGTTMIRKDTKVFQRGQYVIGFTSSFRFGQLLRYEADLPPLPDGEHDAFTHMVTKFMPAVQTAIEEGGYASKDKEGRLQGGIALVGLRGRLFYIDSDMHVGEPLGDYHAIGSGEQVALGSLFSTGGKPAAERVDIALRAAAEHKSTVRAPMMMVASV
jgi:ATP-dependent protease HslVU (ClpYQ) peptidase subunit